MPGKHGSARNAVLGGSKHRSIEAAGGKALAIKADAADTEAVRLAVAKTVGTFGGIDILVNNAGVGIIAPIEQFSLVDFEKLIAVNVRGLFSASIRRDQTDRG